MVKSGGLRLFWFSPRLSIKQYPFFDTFSLESHLPELFVCSAERGRAGGVENPVPLSQREEFLEDGGFCCGDYLSLLPLSHGIPRLHDSINDKCRGGHPGNDSHVGSWLKWSCSRSCSQDSLWGSPACLVANSTLNGAFFLPPLLPPVAPGTVSQIL